MKLQKLRIKNFKSIVDLELVNPSPFSVFVGPNGAGKSNIFEALEYNFFSVAITTGPDIFWDGINSVLNQNLVEKEMAFEHYFSDNIEFKVTFDSEWDYNALYHGLALGSQKANKYFSQFFNNFLHLSINNDRLKKRDFNLNSTLKPTASNLEFVLRGLLQSKRENLLEWLQFFIPEFTNIEIHSDSISNQNTLLIYERYSQKPFNKSLISDGTYNILALLTAVFQSDEPQFLCIEEPENGLHPQVIMTLVDFFRQQCEDYGHYIWINTHSESLVRKLRPEEIILVDKREGETKVKQVRDMNLYDLPTDEAWLTGALGGGLPW